MQKQEHLVISTKFMTVGDAIRQALGVGRIGRYRESDMQLILFVLQNDCKISPNERLINCPREVLEKALYDVLGSPAENVLTKIKL